MVFIQKQNVPLSFTGGLQNKTDSLQLQPPSLLELENAKFDKLGALNKRPGYDILPNNILSDGVINTASAVDTFNNELNLFDNHNIYTYISAMESWANRGPAISLINTNEQIIRSAAAQQLNPDSTILNGIEVFVWEDSRGGCRYSVLDSATNAYCVADQLISGARQRPKVINFNNLIYVLYASANNLSYRTINPNNANLIGGQFNLAADGYGNNFPYDCCVSNDRLYVSYFSDATINGELDLFYLDVSNIKSSVIPVATGTNAIKNSTSIATSVIGDSLNQIWVSWSTGLDVRISCYDGTFPILSNIFSNLVVDTVICPLLGSIESLNKGVLQLVYEIKIDPNPSDQSCKTVTIQTNQIITQIGKIASVGLATKPFFYNGDIFVHLTHQSTLQSTYFMALLNDVPFTIVSKVAPLVGGGLRTNNIMPEIVAMQSGVFLWSNLIKGRFLSEDNTSFSLLGVNSTISDFTNINKFNSVTFSDNLLFVGGILQNYDGVSVNEQNFHLFPEDIRLNKIIPNAGALSAGQYQYQVVYAWTDKFGQIQYSSPSPTLTVTVPINAAVELIIPTLRLTAKTGVVIQVYRTQVNETIFFDVTSLLTPPDPITGIGGGGILNDPNARAVTFTDVAADISIRSNQTIYTTGGVLPNISPPSCSMISLFNDRVILGGLEDPNLLWFSKNKINNSNFNTIPVEFSLSLTIGVNDKGGPITALGLMDQNLIIFKRSAIFIMTGEGPNDAGGGNNFPDPQVITQSVGCINPNSIVLTGQGLMFQTPDKGIWLLDRSLGPPQYIGAGVDDLAKQHVVSSANLDQNSNSVIFTTFDGPALVYDYLIGQWSTWTNHQSVDAVIFENDFTFCKSNGQIYKQNHNLYYDGIVGGVQVRYAMELSTPWISYAQLLGYQSIFRFFILGQYKGVHNLNVEIGYNFNPAFTKSVVIDATSIAGANTWGSDPFWGSSTPWGGNNYGFSGSVAWHPYIFQVNMPIQRCTSFRIKIFDYQFIDNSTHIIPLDLNDEPIITIPPAYNEGYTISGLLFELGALADGVRVPLANKVGAS